MLPICPQLLTIMKCPARRAIGGGRGAGAAEPRATGQRAAAVAIPRCATEPEIGPDPRPDRMCSSGLTAVLHGTGRRKCQPLVAGSCHAGSGREPPPHPAQPGLPRCADSRRDVPGSRALDPSQPVLPARRDPGAGLPGPDLAIRRRHLAGAESVRHRTRRLHQAGRHDDEGNQANSPAARARRSATGSTAACSATSRPDG